MAKVKYTKELLEPIVQKSMSLSEVLRNIGLRDAGSNFITLKNKLNEFNIDYSHFSGRNWNKNEFYTNKVAIYKLEDILKENVRYSSDRLRKRLIAENIKKNECELCGYTSNLELHHINGNHADNRLENLQILCPNCHAKTPNYRKNNITKNTGELIKKDANHMAICQHCHKEFYSPRLDRHQLYCCRECYYAHTNHTISKDDIIKNMQKFNNIKDLANYLNISRTSLRKYLKLYNLYDIFKIKYDFHAKCVELYDINMNLLKIWPSVSDAEESLSIASGSIIACCKRKRRSAGGFLWKYAEENE